MLTEELSISDFVTELSKEIFDRIQKQENENVNRNIIIKYFKYYHKYRNKKNGTQTIPFIIKNLVVNYTLYLDELKYDSNADFREVGITYEDEKSESNVICFCDMILNINANKKNLYDKITHEVEHILDYCSMNINETIKPTNFTNPISLYALVNNANLPNNNFYKLFKNVVYYTFKDEENAFISQLYRFYESHINNNITDSNKLYNLSLTFPYYNILTNILVKCNSIQKDNQYNEVINIVKKYGFNLGDLKTFCIKSINNSINNYRTKSGKILSKVLNDKKITKPKIQENENPKTTRKIIPNNRNQSMKTIIITEKQLKAIEKYHNEKENDINEINIDYNYVDDGRSQGNYKEYPNSETSSIGKVGGNGLYGKKNADTEKIAKSRTKQYWWLSGNNGYGRNITTVGSIRNNIKTPEEQFDETKKLDEYGRNKYYGGNSGYVGYSKSKRAVDAEDRGLKNKTQMNIDFTKEIIDYIKKETNEDVKLTLLSIRKELPNINADEWHHTSKYGNKTNYYSVETIGDYFIEKLKLNKINEPQQYNQKELIKGPIYSKNDTIQTNILQNIDKDGFETNINLDKGQKILHQQFGSGIVKDISDDGRVYLVDFEDIGEKKLLKKYTKLKKIN